MPAVSVSEGTRSGVSRSSHLIADEGGSAGQMYWAYYPLHLGTEVLAGVQQINHISSIHYFIQNLNFSNSNSKDLENIWESE